MRTLLLIPALLALGACGKADAPPAQTSASPPAPAAAAATAEVADAVAAPTWTPPAESAVADSTPAAGNPVAATQPEATPAPAVAPATAAAEPALAPVAAPETQAAAPVQTAPVPATTPVAISADAPYQVVDGRIDQNTVEGWKVYRGIGTCATCHGPVGQGGVGPALVESLKERITKDLFVEAVANGRDGTMMKPFGENPIVMQNLDNIYAYLKARADGVLGPENLIKYPLGKLE